MNATTLSSRIIVFAVVLVTSACAGQAMQQMSDAGSSRSVEQTVYGAMPDGRPVHLFTLRNAGGVSVGVSNYAGLITSAMVPDRNGRFANVVVGFDSLPGYLASGSTNALIGRYANRIAQGRFVLDGREHTLALNNGPHHLHGGPGGFHRKLWDAQPFENDRGVGVELTYVSPDGEENYPGTLTTRVSYTLTDDNELILDYRATTDQPTHLNLTHHVYFNLTADPARDILTHELMLNASRFTPADSTLIPTGEIASVEGTPLDFRRPTAIGARIDADHPQVRLARGYDHNWVIDGSGDEPRRAARLHEPESGRVVEVLTTEPGIQVYTGFRRRHAVALETQHFPNSPNQPEFPSTVLRPGEEFRSTTIYRFSVQP